MLMAFRFSSFGEVLVHGDVGDPRKQQIPATGCSWLVAGGLLRIRTNGAWRDFSIRLFEGVVRYSISL